MIKADEHAVGQPFKLICKCCGKVFESKCGKENKENYISHLGRVRFSGLPFLVVIAAIHQMLLKSSGQIIVASGGGKESI